MQRYLVIYGEHGLTVDALSLHQACVVAVQRRGLMMAPRKIGGPSPTHLVVESSLIDPDASGRWYLHEIQDEPRISGTVTRVDSLITVMPPDEIQYPCEDCHEDRGEGPSHKRFCGRCRLRRRREQRRHYQERLRGAG